MASRMRQHVQVRTVRLDEPSHQPRQVASLVEAAARLSCVKAMPASWGDVFGQCAAICAAVGPKLMPSGLMR